MSAPAHILFVGLPGSGKTTYLAALWHVLNDRTSATSLKLTKLSGDRTYLSQITTEWRECSQVPRTNFQAEQVVVLHLDGAGFGSFDLTVPDLSGEAFEQQVTDRRMSLHHDELVRQSAGVMLFMHPDVKNGAQLTEAARLVQALGGAEVHDNAAVETVVPWSTEKMPTQVQLVELLQFLLERTPRKLRVAVVVSAWDLVDKHGPPYEFLTRHLPLLQQFLAANDDLMEHAVFGVSAQGGDITDQSKKLELLELDDALMRITVRHGDDVGNDITMPIAWLLGAK